MARKEESKWNIEYLSNEEMYALIRYLEPDSPTRQKSESEGTGSVNEDTVFIICVSLVLLALGCMAFVWLYYR